MKLQTMDESGSIWTTKRLLCILAGLFVSVSGMAQTVPFTAPVGFDQGGQYPAGAINAVSYFSPSQNTNDSLYVYTPPGYDPSKKYPVVYAYPGIGTGPDTIFADWGAKAGTVADSLIGQGKIRPVIIVAIDDNNGDVQSDTLNVIIPYIDSHYPTYADADHRGLYGFSWGGGYSFNVGCGNLNTFHYLSPSSAAPNKAADTSLFPNGGAEAKQKLKCLLISCGTSDWDGLYPGSLATHNFCVSNNIPHAWWPVNGAGHDSSVWKPAMWNFLLMADAAGFGDPPRPRPGNAQVEAESYDSQLGGVIPETCSEGGQDVGSIQNGSCLVFNNVDFGLGASSFNARVASATGGGNIELHLDSTNGALIGTCVVPGTGGWQTWVTQSCAVNGITGKHNLFLKFTGGSGYLFNVNWWTVVCTNPPAPQSAPGGLVATPGVERVALKWNSVANASTYNIKRGLASGGPYTSIASVAATSFTDRAALAGTAYYYTVSASNQGGESTNSVPASAGANVNVPAPWLAQDVGNVGLLGGTSFTNGAFTLIGSGADIGASADAFRFVYTTSNSDCSIIARVASVDSYINSGAKAGVMIRQSADANSASVFVGLTPGNGLVWQYRSSSGGGTALGSMAGPSAPYWVRVARVGNTFTGYYSTDGVSWTQIGNATVTMANTVYVGLGISSHEPSTLCSATFDHVTGPGWNPPSAPTPAGLSATAGVERVTVKWQSSSNAISYNLKRAFSSKGLFTTIANLATTNYTDTFVIGRTPYYYAVSAMSAAGESADSAAVTATPSIDVPLVWTAQDIGAVGIAGTASFTNGAFTLTGSGDDIWNTADAFRFAYIKTNSLAWTAIARVASLQNIASWSKAGIMVRQSLDSNAANAFIALTPGNGATWQYRSAVGGNCNNANTPGLNAPYWVKLTRNGSLFAGYSSFDGINWAQLGSATLTNISVAYIGLAVTAHNNASVSKTVFDNVSVPGWPPMPLQASAVAASSCQANLSWNSVSNATGYNVKRSTTKGGPYTTIAVGVTGTNFIDSVAPVRGGCYYVISAIVAGVETANGPESQVIIPKLSGAIIGTPGSWGNSGNTISNLFDGDLTTYFDAPDPGNGDWAGLDFGGGVSNVITTINYCPRSGFESRMVNGVFQGANRADFADAVTLGMVTAQPSAGTFTSATIASARPFRYVRYLSPNGGYGNLAELEFYGYRQADFPSPALSAVIFGGNIVLSWPAAATGFTLQSKTNLLLGDWVNVIEPAPENVGAQWQVTVSFADDSDTMFYRLAK